MRQAASVFILKPIPSFMSSAKKPWHAEYLEIHVMGIQRTMFRNDRFSTRYNQAVLIEWMYWRMGLVVHFSMN